MGMVAVLAIAPSMFFFASPVISLHFYLQSKHTHTLQRYLPRHGGKEQEAGGSLPEEAFPPPHGSQAGPEGPTPAATVLQATRPAEPPALRALPHPCWAGTGSGTSPTVRPAGLEAKSP